jgi:hypothetical protein
MLLGNIVEPDVELALLIETISEDIDGFFSIEKPASFDSRTAISQAVTIHCTVSSFKLRAMPSCFPILGIDLSIGGTTYAEPGAAKPSFSTEGMLAWSCTSRLT